MAKVGPAIEKDKKALAPVSDGGMPTWLRDSEAKGMELVRQYVTPPRLKVVQRQSLPPLSVMFSPGDVIAMPAMTLLFEVLKNENGRPKTEGKPFSFVPLFFYPEWVLWNPMEMKGVLPAIRKRTTNPRDEIAIRAKSPDTWSMKCPEMPEKDGKPLYCRFVEHLNFVLWLLDTTPLGPIPVTMSFARGEHRAGTAFAGLLQTRNAKCIFGCQFEGRVGPRQRGDNAWLGIDVNNPSVESGIDPWVQDKDAFDRYAAMHEDMAKAYAGGLLMADYGDEEESSATTARAEY